MKKKEVELSLMAIALFICTILTVITEYHVMFQPHWIKDVICVLISFIFSWAFVFGVLKKIILMVWAQVNKKYHLSGKWYVIYHEESDSPKYIRSGRVELKQYIDELKMYNLLMRTPMMKNGEVLGLDDRPTRDNEPEHSVSTGSGEYTIDFNNLLLNGFFILFRAEDNRSIMGLDICTIHLAEPPYKSPQRLSGHFYNAETRRNKPTLGVIVLFKNKRDAENYIKNRREKLLVC